MNEELRKLYRNHQGIPERVRIPGTVNKEIAKQINEHKPLLDAIYSINPKTRLPNGDIACYLSSETSPEVKKYILDNLMLDTSQSASATIPDGIDDDTAFALQRGASESLSAYTERLNSYMDEQGNLIDLAKRADEIRKQNAEK